jgi:hypothetical protein
MLFSIPPLMLHAPYSECDYSSYCYCLRGGITKGVTYTATITDELGFPIQVIIIIIPD